MEVGKQSANQVWKRLRKEGQTTLDFVPWLEREKKKEFKNFAGDATVPINTYLNESVQQAISSATTPPGATTKKYILGAPKAVWIGIGAGLVIVAGIVIYKKIKG